MLFIRFQQSIELYCRIHISLEIMMIIDFSLLVVRKTKQSFCMVLTNVFFFLCCEISTGFYFSLLVLPSKPFHIPVYHLNLFCISHMLAEINSKSFQSAHSLFLSGILEFLNKTSQGFLVFNIRIQSQFHVKSLALQKWEDTSKTKIFPNDMKDMI